MANFLIVLLKKSGAFIFFLLILQQVSAQPQIKFKHLTNNDGLSQSNVLAILQDRKGFMWFCTRDGLNKYDGYKFEVFKHDHHDTTTLAGNDVRDVLEDKEGDIWIATFGGLSKYNRNKNNFTRYTHSENPQSISSNTVTCLYEDESGDIWVGTSRGFHLFDKETGTFTRFQHDPKNPNSLSHRNVTSILEDKEGYLWIGTYHGLNKFDRETGFFTRYYHHSENVNSLGHNYIYEIFEDSRGKLWIGSSGGLSLYRRKTDDFFNYRHETLKENTLSHDVILSINEDAKGRLWIGTENGGLNIFNVKLRKFEHYAYDEYDNASLSNNSVYSIYRDRRNSMWVGTFSGGVNFYDKDAKQFNHYYKKPGNSESLSSNKVYAIDEDSYGIIWIGTDGGGINRLNPETGHFKHYFHEEGNGNSLSGNHILSLMVDRRDNVWVGTWGDGVSKFAISTNKFVHYKYNPRSSNSLSLNNISSVYEDRTGGIWISTVGEGLNYLNAATGKFIHYKENSTEVTLGDDYPCLVYEDKMNNIWIGTEAAGIFLFNRRSKEMVNFTNDPDNPKSISGEKIFEVFEDSKGNIWVGTNNGLNLFNHTDSSFSAYYKRDGLASNVIKSILEDDRGNLWMGTNKGLSKFNPRTKIFKNYMPSDGLQGNEFNRNAALKASDGRLYFGGVNGFNVFHPDQIKDNDFIPPVVITDFKIFNQTVPVGTEDSPLSNHIEETKEIVLSHKHSVFSFEFAALNFTAPEKNQYAYMMAGFEKNWNYVGNKRTATYTNLSPGEYVFKVKASNNDGIWNEEGRSVKITIVPPYWQTWWFRLLALLVAIALGFVGYFSRVNRIEKQKKALEKQVKARTSEIMEQKRELEAQADRLQKANGAIKAQGQKLEVLYADVQASIRAAKTVQNSILPSEKYLKQYLPDSFIFFSPKDLVSGDFYWFNVIKDQVIVAVADCTGHGVSGAFMAINGYHLLNQATLPHSKKLTASEVLDRINESILRELKTQNKDKNYGGMDIALCIIDQKNKVLQYAGANNPLYLLRQNEVIQVKANPFPVGWIPGGVKTFTNHEIALQKNDLIYLFSDGYADQIGGKDNGKFMYPRFRNLLLQVQHENMEMQKEMLALNFKKWKGNADQLDDVLVMGMKF